MDVLVHKKFPDDLLRYLMRVYQDKTLCDTVIHTQDGGAFHVHKIIVTASSTYLHNVLSQANQVHSSFSVDVKAEILQVLLEYMYSGQLFVSPLTQNSIFEAATYLQIYPVLDLLKETTEEDFISVEPLKNNEEKVYLDTANQVSGYDSENTIVDETELAATLKSIEDEKNGVEIASDRHLRKSDLAEKRKGLRDCPAEEIYTAIKVEKDIVDETESATKKRIRKHRKDGDPDYNPKVEIQKNTKRWKDKAEHKSRAKQIKPSATAVKTRPKLVSRKQVKSKTKSKKKKKGQAPAENLVIKTEKSKVGKENKEKLSKRNKKVLQVKQDGAIKLVMKGTAHVHIKQEKDVETVSKSGAQKRRILRTVCKPSTKNKCVCKHCNRKFPAYIFLRKHLLICHKQSFYDDWEFSRYLIKFYSGISKYVENCMVDIRGHRNKYRCLKCKKVYNTYCLYCLHLQREHMKRNTNFHGKFFLVSRKQKRIKNFLCGILAEKGRNDQQLKVKKKVKKIKTAKCGYCHKMFVNNLTLRAHQKKMHGIQPQKKYNILREASRSGAETKLFQCVMCQTEKYMISQYALQKHLRDFHKLDEETARMRSYELPYQLTCEVISCGFKTNNMLTMKTHVTYMHPFIQHPCKECTLVFQVRLMLERHKHHKHSPKEESFNYMCAHCDKRFPKQFRLKVHEFYKHGIEHADIKIFRCDAPGCQYVTASQSSLKVHGSKHVKEKRFTCEFCGMKLKTTLSHQKHVNKMHLGIRPYLCQVCGQSFGEEHELKSHIRNRHTTDYDFQCDHCPYRTTNKGTFYTHLYNVHKVRAEEDKRKEFRCPHPDCNFVSILHHRFQTHLNGHTNTRTYCCKPCNKWFVSSSTLRAHKQWYHSDKFHSCTQCSYQTKTSQKLNEHVRVQHQLKGLKPFKCPYCDFRCATGGNTRKHVKQVHRGRVITYLRDDSILNAAKLARASGQNQPLINIMPAEALNASVTMSYPASAKKLGLLPAIGEGTTQINQGVQSVPEEIPDKKESAAKLMSTKMEIEQVPASISQIPESANQMVLRDHTVMIPSLDPRTQGPVDLGAQVTVDIRAHLTQELRNQLSAELRSQVPEDIHCQINPADLREHLTAELRNQMTTDHHRQVQTDIHNQVHNDIHNQLPLEQTMHLPSTGQPLPYSTGHDYIPVSGSHLMGGPLMPMMIAPQVQVSIGSYEEVKDSTTSSNLTIIG